MSPAPGGGGFAAARSGRSGQITQHRLMFPKPMPLPERYSAGKHRNPHGYIPSIAIQRYAYFTIQKTVHDQTFIGRLNVCTEPPTWTRRNAWYVSVSTRPSFARGTFRMCRWANKYHADHTLRWSSDRTLHLDLD